MKKEELRIKERRGSRVRTWLVVLFLLSMVAMLVVVAWQNSRYGRAYALEMMARKLPSSSIQAKRLQAIAEAIRHGKSEYTFTMGRIPSLGK